MFHNSPSITTGRTFLTAKMPKQINKRKRSNSSSSSSSSSSSRRSPSPASGRPYSCCRKHSRFYRADDSPDYKSPERDPELKSSSDEDPELQDIGDEEQPPVPWALQQPVGPPLSPWRPLTPESTDGTEEEEVLSQPSQPPNSEYDFRLAFAIANVKMRLRQKLSSRRMIMPSHGFIPLGTREHHRKRLML